MPNRTEASSDRARRFALWFDPELFLYGLVGLVAMALGARALAQWVAASWSNGQRLLPSLVIIVVAACMGAVLMALRSRKRWFYLATALSVLGAVIFLLASLGFDMTTIP